MKECQTMNYQINKTGINGAISRKGWWSSAKCQDDEALQNKNVQNVQEDSIDEILESSVDDNEDLLETSKENISSSENVYNITEEEKDEECLICFESLLDLKLWD